MILRACILALLFASAEVAQNESWEREKREIAGRKIERLENQIGALNETLRESDKAIARLQFQAEIGTWLFTGVGALVLGAIGKWILSRKQD